MKFTKFASIENSYREKYIDILYKDGYNDIPWVVTEKIDGCNFQFCTDGKEVRIGSRSQFVTTEFYNCEKVVEQYSDKILALKNERFPNAEQITVYGELFGMGIQNRVFYGPDKYFMAYDILVDGVLEPVSMATSLLILAGIPTPPTFGMFDSLTKALEVEHIFVSRVTDVTLPDETDSKYELGENDAEGLVLRPNHPVRTGNGSLVILKNKHPKFAEKKKKVKAPREANPFIELVSQYVTESRMVSVVSKFGEPEQKDFGKLIGLMCNDVIEDMIKDDDLPSDWKKQDEYKLFGKAVSQVVALFLKENLLRKL